MANAVLLFDLRWDQGIPSIRGSHKANRHQLRLSTSQMHPQSIIGDEDTGEVFENHIGHKGGSDESVAWGIDILRPIALI